MKSWFVAGLAVLSALALPQELDKKPEFKPTAVRATGTLNRNDFFVAYQRLQKAADLTLNLESAPTVKPERGTEPVTRAEIVQVMGKMLEHFKPRFRSIPRPGRVAQDAIRKQIPASVQPLAEKLVLWGFVAPEGPLVVGPGNNLTANEAGDALGYFFSQLTVLSHKPIPKWTPRLQPLDGG